MAHMSTISIALLFLPLLLQLALADPDARQILDLFRSKPKPRCRADTDWPGMVVQYKIPLKNGQTYCEYNLMEALAKRCDNVPGLEGRPQQHGQYVVPITSNGYCLVGFEIRLQNYRQLEAEAGGAEVADPTCLHREINCLLSVLGITGRDGMES